MKSNFTLPQMYASAYSKRHSYAHWYFSHFLKIVSLIVLFFGSAAVYSQTFPPASSCTSKDLLLVNATLPYEKCETCTDGTVVTKPLALYINNKTGSTRTSFAFWANLIVIKANGDTDYARSGPISKCFSTIPKNATTKFDYGNISFLCGESLVLTSIWEAWTDAAPNSTCPTLLNSTSTINPKCGIVSSLNVIAGDAASITPTNATCTSTGSLQVFPYGGTGPYKVALGNNSPVSVAIGGSTTFTGLSAGTYDIYISDANNCTPVHLTRTITTSGTVSAPTSGGDQSVCSQSPIQTLTATATASTGATITWWTMASGGSQVTNPTLNTVGDITYYAQASNGTCTSSRTAVKLTINETPNAPTAGSDQSECSQSPIQTLTATATAPAGSTLAWWDQSTGGNSVANPTLNSVGTVTYYAEATIGSCSSSRVGVSLAITATPAAPSVAATDNCDGISILTASNYSGSLLWSTGSTTDTIHVNNNNTYTVVQTVGGCSSSAGSGNASIKTAPAAPSASMLSVACTDKAFSVQVNSPVTGITYSLTQPGNNNAAITIDHTSAGDVIFTGLTFGDGYSVTATSDDGGCASSADECGSNDNVSRTLSATSVVQNQAITLEQTPTKVTAIPNPYNNIIRFSLQSDVSGQGTLELYNLLGQKVKTVYQGLVQKGFKQTFDYAVPAGIHSNLIYLFRVGNERKSGILIGAK